MAQVMLLVLDLATLPMLLVTMLTQYRFARVKQAIHRSIGGPAAKAEKQNEQWQCLSCTLLNSGTDHKCTACGKDRLVLSAADDSIPDSEYMQ
jgi:hypothetical protein